jgi:hypothetical protein
MATNPNHSSERVRCLFAAMIKQLVKADLGYEMRDGEALDLTRYGSLAAAISSIERGIEVNQQFPDPTLRISLAIQEASILADTSSATASHARDLILQARAKAFELHIAQRGAGRKRDQVRASLRERMAEIQSWGRDYTRFVNRMARLYSERVFELRLLNLREEIMKDAVLELDELFENAFEAVNENRAA